MRATVANRFREFRKIGVGGLVGHEAATCLKLAEAEQWAADTDGVRFSWFDDDSPDLGDHEYWCANAAARAKTSGEHRPAACEHEILCCQLWYQDRVVASLSGIIDPDDGYERIVQAELAAEAMAELTPEPPAEPIRALESETLTIDAIYRHLRPELEKRDDGLDYFSVASLIQYDNARRHQPIGKARWIACYAVTGGSEGHYIHVDRIYEATEYARTFTLEALFLGKTFSGYDKACELAAYIGARLGA